MASTFKLYADKMGATDPATYIGRDGDIFYDPDSGALKRSDGVTPGGIPITSEGLTVQDDTLINEYIIYVGNPANKLSSIQDYRQIHGAVFVYDNEFEYLDQAFKFIMENPINETGYVSYLGGERKVAYTIALEENVTHFTSPADSSNEFHLWNVNHQVMLLNQNALNPTPATAECFATIGGDIKLWGVPLFQLSPKDLKMDGEFHAQAETHIRSAANAQGFEASQFLRAIKIENSYARLQAFKLKPSANGRQIGVWDDSVLDWNSNSDIDETNGSIAIDVREQSLVKFRGNLNNFPFYTILVLEDSYLEFTNCDITMERSLSVESSTVRLTDITLDGTNANLILSSGAQIMYNSFTVAFSATSHTMGGVTGVPINDPLLQLQKVNWADGCSTINLGATQNTIAQHEGTFRLPNIDTTERNALTPANGDMIYNTTDSKLQGYQAGAWINIDGT